MPEPEKIAVFLTNAIQTSQGPGPGARELPQAEAAALVRGKMAVYGSEPPEGYDGGGTGLAR